MSFYERRIYPLTRPFRRYLYWLIYPKRITHADLTGSPLVFETRNDTETYRIARYGGERELLIKFLALLRTDDVIFDIGASVGLYSITAAATATNGHVYAFEPDPKIRQRLVDNAEINKLTNVSPIGWAVGASQGTVSLFTHGIDGSSPSLRQLASLKRGRKIDVQVNTIDNVIASGELPIPTVVKIDIEGAEMLALEGMKELLFGILGKPPRIVILEIHPKFLPHFGKTTADLDQWLRQLTHYHVIETNSRSDEEIRLLQHR